MNTKSATVTQFWSREAGDIYPLAIHSRDLDALEGSGCELVSANFVPL